MHIHNLMTSHMYIHTCVRAHTHKGSYLPSQHCRPRAQATYTLLHLLLLLTPTPKHSRFPTITVTPQAHIHTISYSHSVSLPPVIRLASPPAKLLSHARSLIPPYSQIQLSKHLHISVSLSLTHTHTHTHKHNCPLLACPPHPSSGHSRNEETQGTSHLPQ